MRIFLLLTILISSTAIAEIEKFAVPSGSGFQAYWWPKLSVVGSWEHNREASIHYGANFQLPKGETLNGAETVIYARAIYKPRAPELKSIQELIDKDLQEFQKNDPKMKIEQLPKKIAKNSIEFKLYKLSPDLGKNWEVISFGEEGDFYLMFVVSSRSNSGLEKSIPSYNTFMENYE